MVQEAIDNVQRLGYTHDEANFLCLAAVHSGYFLRRQFLDFAGSRGGGCASRFIEKVLASGHVQVVHFRSNRLIYHIRSQRIYARLDKFDNRNRREKAPLTIKRKLMCLDFVLAHRDQHFLADEEDKVQYFALARRLWLDNLPCRRYQSDEFHGPTFSYFVEKLPIYVSNQPVSDPPADQSAELGVSLPPPVVHFCYVDEGTETIAGFETFLLQHHGLFLSIRAFEVVYVAYAPTLLEQARTLFRRLYPEDGTTTIGGNDPAFLRLLRFFKVHRQIEQHNYRELRDEDIIDHNGQMQELFDEHAQNLYKVWIAEGETGLRREVFTPHRLASSFRTFVLQHEYELFARPHHAA
jgi:hypothetical protein